MTEYFLLLVDAEEDIFPKAGGKKSSSQSTDLERKRKALLSRARRQRAKGSDFSQLRHWLDFYAALGSLEQGASLKQVAARSRRSSRECERRLDEMVEARLVVKKAERYFATNSHLISDHLGRDLHFKRWYLETLKKGYRKAQQQFDSDEDLFFCSVFSVHRKRMADLKVELRETILRYIDDSEAADGDSLARISLAFFSEEGINPPKNR